MLMHWKKWEYGQAPKEKAKDDSKIWGGKDRDVQRIKKLLEVNFWELFPILVTRGIKKEDKQVEVNI